MRNDFFSTIKEILKYGGSTFAALAAVSIYTTIDGIFVGNFIGTDGLEALAMSFPVILLFMALSTLFETGASAIVSEKIGAKEKNLAEKIMRTNYFFAFFFGIFVAILGNILIKPLLYYIVNNSEEIFIANLAISYLRIMFC